MKKLLFIFIISMFATLGFSYDEIKIGSGAAPAENIFKPIKDAFEKSSGIKLNIVSSGPKAAFQDLDKGLVDAAAGGLSYIDWLDFMKAEGVEVKNKDAFQAVTIGKDKIKVLINKDNPVQSLTQEQLVDIYTGKVTNWKDVGGNDMAIIIVVARLTAANSFFASKILKGETQLKDVLEVSTVVDLKNNIIQTPEAIGIGPMALIDNSVKSPDTPEVARQINLLTKGKPSVKVQKLIDFIKDEGSKYIKK